MKKRFTIIAALIAALVLTAFSATGCYGTPNSSGYTENQLSQSSYLNEAYNTETLMKVYDKDLPELVKMFQSQGSLEREMLKDRLTRLNVAEKVGYVYLIDYGKVMSYNVIKGKVTSVNSQLTDPTQIVTKRGYDPGDANHTRDWTELQQFVVDSPDLNGTYGPNGPPDAVFFFLTDGTYAETTLKYAYYDRPMNMSTQPELTRVVK